MELEGTGVRVVNRAARPDADRDGLGLGPGRRLTRCSTSWQAGAWPVTRTSCAPSDVAAAVAAVVGAPPASHFTVIEVEPEAPVDDRHES